jgi:hypothetical protein
MTPRVIETHTNSRRFLDASGLVRRFSQPPGMPQRLGKSGQAY